MKYIYITLSVILLFGCQNNIQKKIINKIHQECKNLDTCTIKISDVTNFEWDRMYLFKDYTTLEEINKTLGFNYRYFQDIARRIIFVKSKEVIYHDDEYPYSDENPKDKVFFHFGNDTACCVVFTKTEAVFKVQRKKLGKAIFYELTPN